VGFSLLPITDVLGQRTFVVADVEQTVIDNFDLAVAQ
jgi:hypothetical protein